MNFEQNLRSLKILLAPLDWGLGHATRCIPVIRQLLKNGCTVTIAAAGSIKTLLQAEFPGVSFVNLDGYNVQYSVSKRFLPVKILLQAPKIMGAIRREQRWLQKLLAEAAFDVVISDNRFGLYTKKVPCIFITHQLLIQAPYRWLERCVQQINYHYINRYSQCWVPDFETGDTIAGRLSHPGKMPAVPVKYLGPLSRFGQLEQKAVTYSWIIILSGPEPQRTILEQKLLAVIPGLAGKMLLVRGKPGSTGTLAVPPNCMVVNHLGTVAMQEALAVSDYVLSRCGYTTVMEMLALGKKALFIPTPGQTEQEYLAGHLFSQHWCYTCSQHDDLGLHMGQAAAFDYKLPVLRNGRLKEVVEGLFENL